MRAVLLAAGLGTRLRPLTNSLPKCLAPVRGRPLLEYWLRLIFEGGIERAIVNTHHHAALVECFVRNSPWSDRIDLTHEAELLGTGGTLLANASLIGDAPVLVAHADNLTVFDARAFLRAHASRPPATAITMMTFFTSTPSSCGIVSTDAGGVVTGFFEKVTDPPGNNANAAVYVFEPGVIQYMRRFARPFVDLSTEILPNFIGRMFTWHNAAYHRDIGTLESWRAAQHDFPLMPSPPPDPDPWKLVLARLSPEGRETVANLLYDHDKA